MRRHLTEQPISSLLRPSTSLKLSRSRNKSATLFPDCPRAPGRARGPAGPGLGNPVKVIVSPSLLLWFLRWLLVAMTVRAHLSWATRRALPKSRGP